VTQGVRADRLGEPGPAGDTPDDPAGPVTVEAMAVPDDEDRAADPFADGQVDSAGGARSERDGDGLATFAHDGEGPMSSLDAEGVDVDPDRFGDPQPVERQQGDQRMLACGAESCGDEERSDLVAVQADGVRFVVDPWAAEMDGRRVGDEAFLFGVAVEAGDGAQPSGDGGRRPPSSLELPSESLDVASANLEQTEVAPVAEDPRVGQGGWDRERYFARLSVDG
jgi:hypothetical protein